MERWADIKGYEGIYSISTSGRVVSLRRGIIKRVSTSKLGYVQVSIQTDAAPKTYLIHRLVAAAFIPNPDNKPCVNHKDLNKMNNEVSNLEWCTHAENTMHAMANGRVCGRYIRKNKTIAV